jgi:hypothetical protein
VSALAALKPESVIRNREKLSTGRTGIELHICIDIVDS